MKKLISILLVAMMLVSAFAAIPVSAAGPIDVSDSVLINSGTEPEDKIVTTNFLSSEAYKELKNSFESGAATNSYATGIASYAFGADANAKLENKRILKIMIPVKTVGDKFTITVYPESVLTSKQDPVVPAYEIAIDTSKIEAGKFATIDLSDYNIVVGEDQILAFSSGSDTLLPAYYEIGSALYGLAGTYAPFSRGIYGNVGKDDVTEFVPGNSILFDFEMVDATAGKPIYDADDLAAMVDGGTYYLANDITLPDTWTPKALNNVTFNGNYNKIILQGTTGLFGDVKGSNIKNFTLEGGTTSSGVAKAITNVTMRNITVNLTKVAGGSEAGGLASNANSNVTIVDCVNNADVSSTSEAGGAFGKKYNGNSTVLIENFTNNGNITGGNTAGGILGWYAASDTSVTFKKCVNTGTIKGSNWNGGLVGTMYNGGGIFIDCVNGVKGDGTKGLVTAKNNNGDGGLVGHIRYNVTINGGANYANINGHWSAGAVGVIDGGTISVDGFNNYGNLNSGDYGAAGAICAYVRNAAANGEITVNNSTNYGTMNAGWGGGFIGALHSGAKANFNNCTNEEIATVTSGAAQGAGGFVGGSYVETSFDKCTNKANVTSTNSKPAGGFVGTTNQPVAIKNSENSGAVTGDSTAGGFVGTTSNTADIKNSENSGAVTGASNTGGFIGAVSNTVTMENCENSGAITGTSHTGGFIGDATGAVSIDGAKNSGNVSAGGWKAVGGLIGWAHAGEGKDLTVKNVEITGTIKSGYAAGIVGALHGSVANTNTFDNCNVNATIEQNSDGPGAGGIIAELGDNSGQSAVITNCSVSGSISGRASAGGLVAKVNSTGAATIENSVVVADVTCKADAGGAIGKVAEDATASVSDSVLFGNVSGVTVSTVAPAPATSTDNAVLGTDSVEKAAQMIISNTKFSNELKGELTIAVADKQEEAEMQKLFAQKMTELENAQAALESALANKADVATLNQMVTEFQTAINASNTAIQGVDNDLQAYKTAQAAIDNAQTLAINTLKANIEAAQAEINNIKTEIQNLKDKDTAIEGTIATLRNDFETAKTNLQNAINALETAMTAAEARLDQLEIDVDALEDDLAKAKQDLADLDQYVKDLEEELKTDIADLKAELDKAIADLEALIGDNLEASTDVLSLALAKLDALINETYELLENADEENKKELEAALAAAELTVTSVIEGLMEDLDEAMSDLEFAIESGDAILDAKIAVLNNALENAEAALKIADAESYAAIVTKMKKADEALDAALKALDKDLDTMSADLAAKDNALSAKDAELTAKDGKLQTFAIVVCVITCVALVGMGGFVAWFFIDKKKKI